MYSMISVCKPIIGQEEIAAATAVLQSGQLAQGARVKALEEAWSAYCGTHYAVAINNGTAGLHTALYAAGIDRGDEVITTPFTFVATANAILMQGARPVFADISPDNFNLDPKEVEAKITPKTKAILAVDLYGQAADYTALKKIAEKNHLALLEDACQSIGATQFGQKTGALADCGVFSLYATKNIMCGEGGMVVTNSEEYASRARMFRNQGQSEVGRYDYQALGYNYRLNEMQAAIAFEQLKKVDNLNEKRRSNAMHLAAGLVDLPGITLPSIRKENQHVFHQFTIRVSNLSEHSRDGLFEYLRTLNIGSGVYYPKPLHLYPHFAFLNQGIGTFPVAEQAAKEVLSLPVHPSLSTTDLDCIIDAVKKYAST